MQGTSWCFTWNNYDDDALQHLREVSESVSVDYLVFGRENAPTTGTPHLQGYLRFNRRSRFGVVQALLPQCHIVRANGSPQQNFEYCSKDGDYTEYGTRPCSGQSQGRRSDFERYRDWLRTLDREPSDLDLINEFPSLFGRYRGALRVMARELCPRPQLREGTLRPWQEGLYNRLQDAPDDRTVEFFVDRDGGSGKSWFCGYVFSRIACVQLLGPGKRDDLAHAVDIRTRVFLINVPRGQIEYLNYGMLEMLKDRMVFSPKYESQMKILEHTPHVIVFTNEDPDETKMTNDRYNIQYLN